MAGWHTNLCAVSGSVCGFKPELLVPGGGRKLASGSASTAYVTLQLRETQHATPHQLQGFPGSFLGIQGLQGMLKPVRN